MYTWLIYLHVFSVLGFLLAHGSSAAVMFRLRVERDPARIGALLDLARAVNGLTSATAVLVHPPCAGRWAICRALAHAGRGRGGDLPTNRPTGVGQPGTPTPVTPARPASGQSGSTAGKSRSATTDADLHDLYTYLHNLPPEESPKP